MYRSHHPAQRLGEFGENSKNLEETRMRFPEGVKGRQGKQGRREEGEGRREEAVTKTETQTELGLLFLRVSARDTSRTRRESAAWPI